MLVKAALLSLAQQCAPSVAPHTMLTLIESESSGNPNAIAVVGAQLADQASSKEEAVTTAKSLVAGGARIAAGLGQVLSDNWGAYGLTAETVFDPCTNIRVAGEILSSCYARSVKDVGEGQPALQMAFSCYYSNRPRRGLVKEGPDQPSYVMKIALNSEKIKVPSIEFKPSDVNEVPPGQEPETPVEAKPPAKPVVALEEFGATQPKKAEPEEVKPDDNSMSWDVMGDF